FFELSEILGPEFRAPFALDVPEYVVDFGVYCVPTLRKADNPRTALVRRVGPDEIPGFFKTAEEPVHGLLAHAGALGKSARANPVWARKLEHRDMRHA